MEVGFAERDNLIGTSGVAPNPTLIPYSTFYTWEYAHALKDARDKGADVVGFNMSWNQAINENILTATLFDDGYHLETQLKRTLAANIPVLLRRKFELKQGKIVCGADPTNAQEADDLVFRRNDGRFKGGAFFSAAISGFLAARLLRAFDCCSVPSMRRVSLSAKCRGYSSNDANSRLGSIPWIASLRILKPKS